MGLFKVHYNACYARLRLTAMVNGECWSLGQEGYKRETLKTRNKGMLLARSVHKKYAIEKKIVNVSGESKCKVTGGNK